MSIGVPKGASYLYISSIAQARALSLSGLSSTGIRSFLLDIPPPSAAGSSSSIGCIDSRSGTPVRGCEGFDTSLGTCDVMRVASIDFLGQRATSRAA